MAYRDEGGRYDRWGGGGSTRSSASARNPFDDELPSSRDSYSSASRYGSSSRDPYSTSCYDSRGYDGGEGGVYSVPEDDYDMRIQAAYRRMEQSSGNSLRTLNDTVRMGVETTEELERQAETLDRVERRLDEIDVDGSKRHMIIKSPFGGNANYFAKRKPISEVTDPKMPASSSQSKGSSKSRGGGQEQQRTTSYDSTGNQIVDKNLEEMEKALHQLRGIGELIGDQLDDSNSQIDRIRAIRDTSMIKCYKATSGMSGQNRRTELYLKEHEHVGSCKAVSGPKRRTELCLKEEHVGSTETLMDEAISTAISAMDNLSHQRSMLSHITGRMSSIRSILRNRFSRITGRMSSIRSTLRNKFSRITGRMSSIRSTLRNKFSCITGRMSSRRSILCQRSTFSDITDRMSSVTNRFPLINSLVPKINLQKRRDSLILGGFIAVCVIVLLLLAFR